MVLTMKHKPRMSSQANPSQSLLSFLSSFLTSESQPPVFIPISYHKSEHNSIAKNKNDSAEEGKKRMQITAKKLLVMAFFGFSALSILSFMRFTITSSSSSFLFLAQPNICSSNSSQCVKLPSDIPNSLTRQDTSSFATTLTHKEFKFLTNIISSRIPCNLLVFGLSTQYLQLSSLNTGGTTIFLEDDPVKLQTIRTNDTRIQIHKVEHHTTAGEAYNLLKHSRTDPACTPRAGPSRLSSCKLALKQLPNEVDEHKWDVILVDGPSGDRLEAPGRMAAIYTAAMISRAGNLTDVFVHDVDRMIERWFTWEFLCEENLISSKGKLWHLRIKGNSSSTSFCTAATVQIV